MYRKNIRNYYLFRILCTINLTVPTFMLFLIDRGLSSVQIFISQAIFTGIELLLTVPSGILADKFGRKRTLIISSITYALAFMIYGFADGFWMVVAAEAMFAVSTAAFHGTGEAFLFDTLAEAGKERKYKQVLGTAFAIQSIMIGGSSVVGAWIASKDLALPFFLSGIPAALSVVPLLFLKEPHRVKIEKYVFKKALVEALKDKGLRNILYYVGLSTVAGYAGFMLYQPILVGLGLPVSWLGVFVLLLSFASALGSKLSGRLEQKLKGKDLLLLMPTLKAGLYLLAYLIGGWWLILLALMLDFIGGAATPLVIDWINSRSSSETRATMNSLGGLASTLSFTLMSPIIGYTVDAFTPQTGYLLIAVLMAGLVAKLLIRK